MNTFYTKLGLEGRKGRGRDARCHDQVRERSGYRAHARQRITPGRTESNRSDASADRQSAILAGVAGPLLLVLAMLMRIGWWLTTR